ncbi:RluA family pseudouridine synthase [Defluviitalea phaphyphila]|uniref:RluA family pseudouridine synthase n=1 Tax=Defluviitalea phaphyphila TaxID=1473580 RepID=UPI000730F005|nr:RluA family pseudouridine synthase [Defluviitalea phaphyphila]
MREIHITEKDANQRLDKFLIKYMDKSSKGFIYKMLRKKRIKYNGKKAKGNENLKMGDSIQLYLSEETINKFREIKEIQNIKTTFEVIFEDKNILLCNKPLGLLVHPDKKSSKNTLIDEVLSYLVSKGEYDPKNSMGFTPGICNRLDRNTSGIIIVGKNLKTLQTINQMIKENKIKKYYLTIVKGVVEKSGILKGYHKKNNKNNQVEIMNTYKEGSKYVETRYRPLKNNGVYTLLEVEIITGRSHQIRAHLSKINHPIIGDRKYGDSTINNYFRKKYKLKHQFLHAYKINFPGKKEFIANMPDIYKKICMGENININLQ